MALQKLGAARVNALTENSRNARSCNACYELLRDEEMGAYPWNFAKTRTVLAPSAAPPAFDFAYAFPIPTDTLTILLPNSSFLDWKIEQQGGQTCILTNQGASINLTYIAKVTDPTRFDPSFALALAYKMAFHMCEEITQSNEKKQDAAQSYKDVIARAKRNNAFQNESVRPPTDSWLTAEWTSRDGFGTTIPGSWYSVP
jgi:hypothetical protein